MNCEFCGKLLNVEPFDWDQINIDDFGEIPTEVYLLMLRSDSPKELTRKKIILCTDDYYRYCKEIVMKRYNMVMSNHHE